MSNVEVTPCVHETNKWNSQSWTQIGISQEQCNFCGVVRWNARIRNAIQEANDGTLFGREIKDNSLMDIANDIRKMGAYLQTSTVHDPLDGKVYVAKAYIFYRDTECSFLSFGTSVSEFSALFHLRKLVAEWYGVTL